MAPTILTNEEKEKFSQAVYQHRKANPDGTWKAAFDAGRKTLPKGRTIGAQISAPGQLPWVKTYLARFEQDEKARPVIDHRGRLPKADDPQPEEVKKKRGAKKGMVQLRGEEQRIFAKACLDARRAGEGWEGSLKKANEALPEHRRLKKPAQWPSYYKWLSPLMDEIVKQEAKAKVPEHLTASVHETAPSVVVVEAAPAPDIEGLFVKALVGAVKEAALQIIQSPRFQSELQAALTPQSKPETKLAANELKPARKKVVVVGLLPIQSNEVQKELGYAYDFRFVGSNTPTQQIKETAKNADIAVLMTQFVSHPTQAAIRQHPGFLFCNGNSSALKHLLQEKLAH